MTLYFPDLGLHHLEVEVQFLNHSDPGHLTLRFFEQFGTTLYSHTGQGIPVSSAIQSTLIHDALSLMKHTYLFNGIHVVGMHTNCTGILHVVKAGMYPNNVFINVYFV